MKKVQKPKNSEKIGKKKKTSPELLTQGNRNVKKRKSNKENVDTDSDVEVHCPPHIPQVTRTGRVVRQTKLIDL